MIEDVGSRRLVAPVTVAAFIVMFVVFVVPMTLVVSPTLLVVVVVRMRPVGARIRGLFIAAGHPAIVPALRFPIAAHPCHSHDGRRRWWWLNNNRRRRNADVQGNLRRSRHRQE